VVADLEEIDGTDQPASAEQCLDRRLGIAAQERGEGPAAQQRHDRCIVDVARRQGRGPVGCGGKEQAETRRTVEPDRLPGHGGHESRPTFRPGSLEEARVARIRVRAGRVDDQSDAIALKHCGQAADMVLVGMGEDDDIDGPLPPRKRLAEPLQEKVGIGTSVDERDRARRRLDEDRVALPDVEDGQVQLAVREFRNRDAAQQKEETRGQRRRSDDAMGQGPRNPKSPPRQAAEWCGGGQLHRSGHVRFDRPGPQSSRPEGKARIPRQGDPARGNHRERGEGQRRRQLTGHDHRPQHQPGRAAAEPGEELARERDLNDRRCRADDRRNRGRKHGERHEGNDHDVGERSHE